MQTADPMNDRPTGEEAPASTAAAPSTLLGTMSLDRAKTLVEQCVQVVTWPDHGRGEKPTLPDCTLEEMLTANRMVEEMAAVATTVDGNRTTWTLLMHVHPQLLAAFYALEQFDGDPYALLHVLGYTRTTRSEKEG